MESISSSRAVLSEDDLIELAGPFFGTKRGRVLGKWIFDILGISKINSIHDSFCDYSSFAFTERVLAHPDVRVSYRVVGMENVEQMSQGSFVAMANHPFGGLDGIILIDLISRIRPKFKVVVNDFLAHVTALRDSFIAIQPVLSRKDYIHDPNENINGLRQILQQIEKGEPIGIFPAGGVAQSYDRKRGISMDQPWQRSSVRLIKSVEVPIFPILFEGTNSCLYHCVSRSYVLKTLKVASELFNKKGHTINVYVGSPIQPDTLRGIDNVNDLREILYKKVFSLLPCD